MEPRIQYAKTADGVSIAFWTLGEGMPIVQMPNIPFEPYPTGVAGSRPAPLVRAAGGEEEAGPLRREGVGPFGPQRGRLLRRRPYAGPAGGGGTPGRAEIRSDSDQCRGAGRHRLRGPPPGGRIAACAVVPLGAAGSPRPGTSGAERDGGLGAHTRRHWRMPRWDGRRMRKRTAALPSCGNAPRQKRHAPSTNALAEFDVATVLSQVRSPTLILQRRQVAAVPGVEVAKGLASGIPDARLVLLEGAALVPWVGDMEAVLAAIDEFLGDGEPAPAGAEPASDRAASAPSCSPTWRDRRR